MMTIFALTACGDESGIEGANAVSNAEETEANLLAAEHEPEEPSTQDEISNEDNDIQPEPIALAPETPAETLLYSMADDAGIQNLSQGTSGGSGVLAETPILNAPGSPTYTIVPNPAGGNSVHLSDRVQNFYALDIYFGALDLTFGASYAFRVTGRSENGITMQLGRTDAPWSAYTTMYVNNGTWSLAHTLTSSELAEHFLSNQRGVRIMTNDAPTAEFYVDSIEVVRIGERGYDEPIFPEWDLTLPSLAESFAEYFHFGNIWSTASRMESFNTKDGFNHHFNAVTAENNHKVDSIASNPNPDAWNFTTADAIVDWAEENDLAMIGHTLVWHSQSPAWLTTVAGSDEPLTRSEAIENMHLYISTVAGRYAGRMYSWDVVNEAIWGVGASEWRANPDWRNHMRGAGRGLDASRQSQWYNAFANGATGDECGSDYIYYAFRFARIYDPFAILYYNDYNDHVPGKRDAIAQMVVQINERWQNDPLYDGRLLIDGIGMQAHYSITGWMTNPRYVRSAIELYIETGARISITEWDIVIGGNREEPADPTPARIQSQADRFGLLMGFYLEFSDYIGRVSLWGLSDNHSWISWGHPLLFDENFRPKPAFFAVIDALEDAPAPNISIPVVESSNIPPGSVNQHFIYGLTATQNNFAPTRWTVTDGALPDGLRLVSATGVILGTPTESGRFEFTVAATNAAGSGTQTFVINV